MIDQKERLSKSDKIGNAKQGRLIAEQDEGVMFGLKRKKKMRKLKNSERNGT